MGLAARSPPATRIVRAVVVLLVVEKVTSAQGRLIAGRRRCAGQRQGIGAGIPTAGDSGGVGEIERIARLPVGEHERGAGDVDVGRGRLTTESTVRPGLADRVGRSAAPALRRAGGGCIGVVAETRRQVGAIGHVRAGAGDVIHLL